MPSNVLMPKTGADATEAKLIRWLKKEGDPVARGEAVAEIETEKVNMEVEAFSEGTLYRILAPEGTTLEVGKPIATLLKKGEQPPVVTSAPVAPAAGAPVAPAPEPTPQTTGTAPAASLADRPLSQTPGRAPASPPSLSGSASTPSAPAPAQTPQSFAHAATAVAAPVSDGNGDGRIKASPLARRMAQEHNLDLSRIAGRGPGGRVVREDVEVAIQAALAQPAQAAPTPVTPPAAQPAVTIPAPAPAPLAAGAEPEPSEATANERALTRIQLTAARRLTESKQNAPHFYVTIEVDMAEAIALRATLNDQADGTVKISVNDMVVKACAWALQRHPDLNGSYRDGTLLLHDHINVSVAIDTSEGLVSPVIPDVDRKSLGQIARETRALAERARAGKLRPDDYSEGTFTVSNLGMFDVDTFVAIINPPQAAILAVGAARQAPVVRNGELTVGTIMKVTLSADHRASDGARAARFLADLRRVLEKPLLMAL